MNDEYTEKDRLAAVARRLYRLRYNDVRRPDRTKLWKSSASLAGVLSRGCNEGSVAFYTKGSKAKYVKEEDAIAFLDEYISTRINANGTTKSPVEDRDKAHAYVKFGFIARLLGVPALLKVLNTIADIESRQLERLDELNEYWKPPTRGDTNERPVNRTDS